MIRHRLFFFACQLVIPLWLLAGSIYKLVERNPKLLPPPVLTVVQSMDGFLWLTGTTWLDTAIRLIILCEFVLVAIMMCMPRLARTVAIAVLSLFCIILLWGIVPEFLKGGFAQAWKGSCGCFGASGPNPIIMLCIDATLLVLAILSKPLKKLPEMPNRFGLPIFASSIVVAVFAVCIVPNRADIDLNGDGSGETPILLPDQTSRPPIVPIPDTSDSNTTTTPTPVLNPSTTPPTTPPTTVTTAALPWPGFPKKAAPYYVPEFATWVGTRLDSQDLARLITPAPPASINTGTWFVIFYREDCEHCHQLLQAHFSGPLKTPTLAVAILDTDPAASMEMPCAECQLRSLVKGPDYVLTTPVMLKVVDGLITHVVTDPEDRAAIEQSLAP